MYKIELTEKALIIDALYGWAKPFLICSNYGETVHFRPHDVGIEVHPKGDDYEEITINHSYPDNDDCLLPRRHDLCLDGRKGR